MTTITLTVIDTDEQDAPFDHTVVTADEAKIRAMKAEIRRVGLDRWMAG